MNKKIIWFLWIVISLGLLGYFSYGLVLSQDKSDFLIGHTTYGHYQIEMECSACHTDAFGGEEILQDACVSCHQEELNEAHDSHPKKKFTDPREAYRLEIIDARYCVSCHTEHKKEQTLEMGVSLPKDYCYHCHQDVLENRESHKELPFDSCANAGCHNYHDNRALYESFLVKHANEPWLLDDASIPMANQAKSTKLSESAKSITSLDNHWANQNPDIEHEFLASAHGKAGMQCSACHQQNEQEWVEKPGTQECKTCHVSEYDGFTKGKHGMALLPEGSMDEKLISPESASDQYDFKNESLERQHGCTACHGAHSFDTQVAQVSACLTCHNDEHSLAFTNSPHGKLWQNSTKGLVSKDEAVTCATCHMPRTFHTKTGMEVELSKLKRNKNLQENSQGLSEKNNIVTVKVEHNQNDNLRPNEKMIRSVCMNCHGLEFSIDALADESLIKNNFHGQPAHHVESVDWAVQRQ